MKLNMTTAGKDEDFQSSKAQPFHLQCYILLRKNSICAKC